MPVGSRRECSSDENHRRSDQPQEGKSHEPAQQAEQHPPDEFRDDTHEVTIVGSCFDLDYNARRTLEMC
jgi:hypothetical protein